MATTDPVQQMAEEIRTLQSRIGNLQDQVRLTDAQSRVSDLYTTVSDLVPRLATLRTRGYVFGKDLENQAQALISSWGLLFPNLQSQVNAQSSTLLNTLRPIEMQIPQLTAVAGNPVVARNLLGPIQAATAMLEDNVSAAEKYIDGMYDQFGDQVAQFTGQLDQVEYLIAQLTEATFQLLPIEAGIAATRAV